MTYQIIFLCLISMLLLLFVASWILLGSVWFWNNKSKQKKEAEKNIKLKHVHTRPNLAEQSIKSSLVKGFLHYQRDPKGKTKQNLYFFFFLSRHTSKLGYVTKNLASSKKKNLMKKITQRDDVHFFCAKTTYSFPTEAAVLHNDRQVAFVLLFVVRLLRLVTSDRGLSTMVVLDIWTQLVFSFWNTSMIQNKFSTRGREAGVSRFSRISTAGTCLKQTTFRSRLRKNQKYTPKTKKRKKIGNMLHMYLCCGDEQVSASRWYNLFGNE